MENSLICETFLRNYFRTEDSLKHILENIYLKDLTYLNAQLEEYINRHQNHAAIAIAESIQQEYSFVKLKEKQVVKDSLANSNSVFESRV